MPDTTELRRLLAEERAAWVEIEAGDDIRLATFEHAPIRDRMCDAVLAQLPALLDAADERDRLRRELESMGSENDELQGDVEAVAAGARANALRDRGMIEEMAHV